MQRFSLAQLTLPVLSTLGAGCAAKPKLPDEPRWPISAPTLNRSAIARPQDSARAGTLVVRVRGYSERPPTLQIRRCPDGDPDPAGWTFIQEIIKYEMRNMVLATVPLDDTALDAMPPDAGQWARELGERRVAVKLDAGKYFLSVTQGRFESPVVLVEPVQLSAYESKEVVVDLLTAAPWEIEVRRPDGSPAIGDDLPGLLQVSGARLSRWVKGHPVESRLAGRDSQEEVRFHVRTFGTTPTKATAWYAWGANGLTIPLTRDEPPSWRYDRTLTGTIMPVRRVALSLEPIAGGTINGTTASTIDPPYVPRTIGGNSDIRSVRATNDRTTVFVRGETETGVLCEASPSVPHHLLREWFSIEGDDTCLTGDGSGHTMEVNIAGAESLQLWLIPPTVPKATLQPHCLEWFHGGSRTTIWIPDSAAALEWRTLEGLVGRTEALDAPSIVIP